MKNPKTFLFGAMLLLASCIAVGSPLKKAQVRDANVSRLMRRMAPNTNVLSSPRTMRINEANAKLGSRLAAKGRLSKAAADNSYPEPVKTFGPSSVFGDLDGPNGELWYYTAELSSHAIQHEYYTEYILDEFRFDIYDSDFRLVGSVHDKMRYKANEVRVPGPEGGIDILPVITKNFFNTDDKYEVVVSVAVNTSTEGVNHYRSVIYSLDGEKETVSINRNGTSVQVEVDKPVGEYNNFIADVLDASTDTEENYYITFEGEVETTGDSYWDVLSGGGLHYVTYSKANAEGKLTKVLDNRLPNIEMQGDQESSPTMLTFIHKGEPYVLCPKYREPFFNSVSDYNEDITMREGNYLDIKLYKLNPGGADLLSTTSIPVVKISGTGIIYNFYSVGDLRYSRDVMFDENDKPLYVVARSNYTAASDELSGLCYYVYDVDGNIKKTIFEGADADLSLHSIPGHADQHMFVSYDDDLGYLYNMVDLSTGYDKKKTVKIPYLLDLGDEDPDVLIVNMDRVAVGDSFKYAIEMKAPVVDEEENDVIRVAWFNADGTFDRIDGINMGQAVNYGQMYLDGEALDPKLFDTDDAYEYMVLVKRAVSAEGSQSREELIIAKAETDDLPLGKTLLLVGPDEQKGALQHVGIYPGATQGSSRLMVGYLQSNYDYTADYYDLPFFTTAINGISADGVSAQEVSFDGKTLCANGQEIKVYNTKGMLVASGNGTLAVDSLPAGIYVAMTGKSVNKFIVR